jgi:hypothetical protein
MTHVPSASPATDEEISIAPDAPAASQPTSEEASLLLTYARIQDARRRVAALVLSLVKAERADAGKPRPN